MVVAVVLAVGAWVAAATPALAASSTFGYSPGYQYFTVPSGVYSVHFDLVGGSGANGQGSYGAGSGASGAEVTGDYSVVPGWVLKIWAGGAGQSGGGNGYGNPTHDDFDGGSGGSGYGVSTGNGGGGGAASYVQEPNGDIVALAGGGGGGGGGGTVATSAGNGSNGAYQAGHLYSYAWDADAISGGNASLASGGFPDGTGTNNGTDGGGGGDGFFFGGGGGGGGGGYFNCINGASTQTGVYCFSAGDGGQSGVNSGGGGGAGGNSYADFKATGVSFTSSGNSPSTAGQITLSYGTASSTTVNAPSGGSLYGQSVRLTAAVDPSDGGGTVTFTSDGIAIPGCANLSFEAGGGTDWLTSCTTTELRVGTHTIIATYSGDSNYTGSSGSATATVQQATSSTSVRASSATSTSGQSVTFNASVDPGDSGGAVTFSSDGSPIPGCSNLSLSAGSGSDWTASCTTSSLSPGTHTITATYSGAVNYTDSSGSTTETVKQATSLTATPSSLLVQRTDKLVATVYYSDGGGTVAFTNNGAPLSGCGAVALAVATGGAYHAVCQQAFLAAGTYSIRASYSGDAGSPPSSASATVHVNPAPVVSSVSPNAGPTDGGQTVTITGWDLSGATKVSFGTTAATNVTVVSDSQITATVPAHAAGGVRVTVTSTLGTSLATSAAGYTYDPLPTVSSISPATGPKGTVVTVVGTGFTAHPTVAFGKTPAAKVVQVSGTVLKVTAPAGSGTVPVSVTTPGGATATSPADQFTYTGS
ncbi:MAG TPA: Ig-like domain repeat protein [Solirubrobacteraceae bacterium]|nr:Ig-like domain repeat protein [Solirubrobacteraceae bacterium]